MYCFFFLFLWNWKSACEKGKEERNDGVPILPNTTTKVTPCFKSSFIPQDAIKISRKPPPTVQQWQDCWCPNPTKSQSPRPYRYPGKISRKSHYPEERGDQEQKDERQSSSRNASNEVSAPCKFFAFPSPSI